MVLTDLGFKLLKTFHVKIYTNKQRQGYYIRKLNVLNKYADDKDYYDVKQWLSWEREASDALCRWFCTYNMPLWYMWTSVLNVLVGVYNKLAGSPPFNHEKNKECVQQRSKEYRQRPEVKEHIKNKQSQIVVC